MFANFSKLSLTSGLALAGTLMIIQAASAQTLVYGSGASFPSLVYRSWFDCYGTALSTSTKPASCTTSAAFKFYYAAVGSGSGRNNFAFLTSTNGTPTSPPPFTDSQTTAYPYPNNDFNGSDAVLSSTDLSNYNGTNGARSKGTGAPLQVPTVVGTINLAYNRGPSTQAQLPSTLNLSRKQYCDIWAGLITNWNQIVTNVNQPITLVVRSDSSGTTADFFFHLDTVCPGADPRISTDFFVPNLTNGSGSSPYPAYINLKNTTVPSLNVVQGNGSNGVATGISSNPYGIGYISASFVSPYAAAGTPGRSLPSARLANSLGTFTAPSPTAAFNAVKNFVLADTNGNGVIGDPADYAALTTYLVNPSGSTAYPIVSTTFLDLYCKVPRSTSVGNSFKGFINAALATSTFPTAPSKYDSLATSLGFAPLGTSLKASVRSTVGQINTTNSACSL